MARLEDAAVLTRSTSFLVVSFSLWLLALAPAHAVTPRKPALQWTRGEGAARCIDPRALAERVESLMGPVLLAPSAAEYAIEAHIDARRRGRFVVRLSVTDAKGAPRGDRVLELSATDCRELDNALIFLIALTIDPDFSVDALLPESGLDGQAPEDALLSELSTQPPAPLVLPSPEEPAPVPAALPPAPRPAEKRREPGRWELSATAAISRRELPATALGAIVGAGWQAEQGLLLRAQLRILSLVTPHALDDVVAMRAQLFAPALLVCSGPRWGRLQVAACLGPELALVRARAVDFVAGKSTVLDSWGALAQLDLRLPLGVRFSLLAQGFVRGAFGEKRFVYQQGARKLEAFQVRGLGGGASFGGAYRF